MIRWRCLDYITKAIRQETESEAAQNIAWGRPIEANENKMVATTRLYFHREVKEISFLAMRGNGSDYFLVPAPLKKGEEMYKE